MTIYPGARHLPAEETDRAEVTNTREYAWHLRHFWRPQGCYVWITTVRMRGIHYPISIIGEHVR